MMNALFLPCLVLFLFLSASLASPVVVSESASAAVANPASASPAVLNSPSAAVPNSESSSSVGLLRLPIPISAPNPISLALYDDFVLYTKYSSTAATEYWQFRDPLPRPFALLAPQKTVTKCEGNEDKKCSVQFLSGGITRSIRFISGRVRF
ncbi:hypothetical protein B0H14DRAFT_3594444 [Mycena olivaceomarginata]|nr:hypothetical protein B0H14DRAFT_3594444 [Mycena olivaceomarginata]